MDNDTPFDGPATTKEMQDIGFEGSDPLTSDDDLRVVEAACNNGSDLEPHRRRILAIIHDTRLASHLVDVMTEALVGDAHRKLMQKKQEASDATL